jgi:hypothetical protein
MGYQARQTSVPILALSLVRQVTLLTLSTQEEGKTNPIGFCGAGEFGTFSNNIHLKFQSLTQFQVLRDIQRQGVLTAVP